MKENQNLWHRIFSFKGTISRKEFIFYALILQTVFIIIGIGILLLSKKFHYDWGIYIGLIIAALSLPVQLAAIVRRSRDRRHNPWLVLILIMIVPVLWIFMFIYLSIAPSKDSNTENTIFSKILFMLFFILALALSWFFSFGYGDFQNKKDSIDKDTSIIETELIPINSLKIDGYNSCTIGSDPYTKDFEPKFTLNTRRNKKYTLVIETGNEILPEYVNIYVKNDAKQCTLKQFKTEKYKIINGYLALLELTPEILKKYAPSPYTIYSENVVNSSIKDKSFKMKHMSLLKDKCCSVVLKYKNKIKNDIITIKDSDDILHQIQLNFKER